MFIHLVFQLSFPKTLSRHDVNSFDYSLDYSVSLPLSFSLLIVSVSLHNLSVHTSDFVSLTFLR